MIYIRNRTVIHVALMLAATAILYAFSLAFLKTPCWALFVLVAPVAWPIWRYQREYALFERRTILAGLMHEESRIRRWLWRGQVSRVLQVFVAIFWATLLLAFASLLVTKRAGTTLVAAAGGAAVCGPLAPLCALAAGAVAWITLDKTFITIDELRFRDEMRAELLQTIRTQKAELASELRALHEAAIGQAVSGLEQSVQRVFVPVREGL